MTNAEWLGALSKAARMINRNPQNRIAKRYAEMVIDRSPYPKREAVKMFNDSQAGNRISVRHSMIGPCLLEWLDE